MKSNMKVCIVGAGVAGLQTASCLIEDNHDCYIYKNLLSMKVSAKILVLEMRCNHFFFAV